ncbi:hypothetical protein [Patiriisocius sp. Uisw_047]|uniref:hypothetical protein n=1 Tax=Patiriisocius sp. Uisw_047 TaxID=3230969 RepID=UPI0039EBB0D7
MSSAFVYYRDTKNEKTIEVNVEDEIIATDDDAIEPIENKLKKLAITALKLRQAMMVSKSKRTTITRL